MMMYQSQFIEMFFGGKYPLKKLKGSIEVLRGVSYKPSDVKDDLSEKESVILRSNNIDNGQINYDDLVYVNSERVSDAQVLSAGDIVMCGSNGSKKLVGKAAMIKQVPGNRTSFGAFCLGIRCKEEIIHPKYLATYFQTSLYRDVIEFLGSGSNILNIKPDHINNLEIPIPDMPAQMEFVSIAEQADKSKFDGFKSQFTARNYSHMHETELHTKLTEATCRYTDGFRTDGKEEYQLPFPVMRFDVNFPAINHPEVALDTDSFMGLFLTDYCKALSRACFCEYNFHDYERFNVESKERLKIEYSIRLDKNRTSTQNEINVLLYSKHESLPSLALNYIHDANILNIYC